MPSNRQNYRPNSIYYKMYVRYLMRLLTTKLVLISIQKIVFLIFMESLVSLTLLRVFPMQFHINASWGPYLIVISGRKFVGKIDGADIWQMTKYKVIPFVSKIKLSPIQVPIINFTLTVQQQDEDRYVFLLDHLLSSQHFYFSYKHDITHRMQHIVTISNEQRQQPLWKRVHNQNTIYGLRF